MKIRLGDVYKYLHGPAFLSECGNRTRISESMCLKPCTVPSSKSGSGFYYQS